MKKVVLNQGNVDFVDISSPSIEKGKILVEVVNSCISLATEMTIEVEKVLVL